jgi:hypothetical protein
MTLMINERWESAMYIDRERDAQKLNKSNALLINHDEEQIVVINVSIHYDTHSFLIFFFYKHTYIFLCMLKYLTHSLNVFFKFSSAFDCHLFIRVWHKISCRSTNLLLNERKWQPNQQRFLLWKMNKEISFFPYAWLQWEETQMW